MRLLKPLGLAAILLGLTAATEYAPRGYAICAGEAAEAYGEAWTDTCHALGRDAVCELSDSEVRPIENDHLAARRACLYRFRTEPPERWWTLEEMGIRGANLAAPKPEKPTFFGWLMSTLTVSLCLVTALNILRSEPDG